MKYNNLFNYPNERTMVTFPFVTWDNYFTPEELEKITAYCTEIGVEKGKVLSSDDADSLNENIRVSGIKFHGLNQDTEWFFSKLNHVIGIINDRWYGFDLNGYEAFQYTEYHDTNKGKYDWHMDMCTGPNNLPANMIEPRKLSMSLVLTEPGTDFEGGDFEINDGQPQTVEQRKGRIIAFPSFMLHRVTPVMKGVRKSIVVWVTGPKFQ